MARRIGLGAFFGLLVGVSGSAMAQTQPVVRGVQTPAGRPPARADQPVMPQVPKFQRLPAPQGPIRAPFELTPQEAAYLDTVLRVWEQASKRVKTFECQFTRWEYDLVFGPPNAPRFIDQGKLKYAAPDRGMFQVTHTEKDGKMAPVEADRAEHWICDGKSVYEYNYAKRQLTQYDLPPGLQGKAIADGPLPFLFGAEAEKLKQRYFLRVIQPPPGRQGETWLEAYPRHQQDAADFRRAELILANKDVMPLGLHVYLPNGKNHTAYQFWDIVIDRPLRFFQGDPFRPRTPLGWKKVVEKSDARQAVQPPPASRRR